MPAKGSLTAFLAARLDEDEPYLNSNRQHLWTQRPLREVEAKRAILAAYEANDRDVPLHLGDFPREHGQWDGLRLAVRQLAAVYSDHPDYRQEWKP